MYAITGITGRVGGAAAKYLLGAGKSVRAVMRDPAKAGAWAAKGAEVAVADVHDIEALAAAFAGAEGVFVMIPPFFAPAPGFPEARAILESLCTALKAAQPGQIVALSSVGAQHDHGAGLITQSHLLEEALGSLGIPVAFVRAAWFMENSFWDIEPVQTTGTLASFLQPLDRPFPMVATDDIGRAAAGLLSETWQGRRVLELEGPRRYSQNDIAAIFGRLLDRPVQAAAIPCEDWAALFEAQGAPADRLAARIEMLDGFNSGWIDFEGNGAEHAVGNVTLETVLASQIVSENAPHA